MAADAERFVRVLRVFAQRIRDRYLFSTEFVLDVISNVPVEVIGPAFGITRGTRKLALLRCADLHSIASTARCAGWLS